MKNAELIKAYSILLLSVGGSSVLLSFAWRIVYSALSWK
jgi:hypothetical protein